MPISKEDLNNLLNSAFPGAKIESRDLAGDNDHWETSISWAGFQGKSMLEQHRMVQAAVKEKDIHALSIKTSAS